MIPILYDNNETNFTRNGLGFLKDCIDCKVTEERNGVYEAEFKYPLTGQLYSEISVDRIVKLKANETSELQLFRIYKNSKPLNGIVTFKAQHISYDLNLNPVMPFEVSSINAGGAISALLDNACFSHNFKSVSDVNTVSSLKIDAPVSVRNCLGGMSGSVLDNFGGEYEFDNFTIKLHKQRGSDNAVSIEYGKNLTSLTSDTDISNTYTSIMPYAKSKDTIITLPEKVISLFSNDNFGCARSKIVDLSSEFEQNENITADKLRVKAKSYLESNAIDKIKTNIKVSFVHLWQSKEYEKYALLERVRLCDTVTVKYTALGVSAKAKVIKTVYNTLNERYESIELGDAKSNFASTINNVNSQINNMQTSINNQQSEMQKAIDNATDIITGQKGGNVVLYPKDHPQEILIMNTDSIETATKIWRFNMGGLGFSSNGYNGSFPLAVTMDGAIVADFITAGTLNADIIKAGTLQGIKIIAKTGEVAGWTISGNQLISNDKEIVIDSTTNTIRIYDSDYINGGHLVMSLGKYGLSMYSKYDNDNIKMNLDGYGLDFYDEGKNLGRFSTQGISGTDKKGIQMMISRNSDALIWAEESLDENNIYRQFIRLMYDRENGFQFSDSVSFNNGSVTLFGKKLSLKTTIINGEAINYVGWE